MVMDQRYETFLDVLEERKENSPQNIAFTFLENGENEEISITYLDLYFHVTALAALLQERAIFQRSVLLLFHSGLEYIIAFLATLQAGGISVPAYPPKNNKNLDRFTSIIDDCNPAIILSTRPVKNHSQPIFSDIPSLSQLNWICVEERDLNRIKEWKRPALASEDIAFLQYTSGSTGSAKGVMISHKNLLHNEKLIQRSMGSSPDDVGGAWLPIFHDMGLIGMVLQPLYVGFRVIFMAPASFLQRPLRWLNLLSNYGVTLSVSPNFGLEICAKNLTHEDCQHLDLSRLRFMMCGAEPINPIALEKFTALLSPFGWDNKAFKPAFGLAEATLMVSSTSEKNVYSIDTWDIGGLQENTLISAYRGDPIRIITAGTFDSELDVRIADTVENKECPDETIGEIIVAGESIAKGYWNKPDATQETFGYMIKDLNQNQIGPFMRTGDLGYLRDNELFITGRTKDLIIIAGKNHYPQDIEWSVENALSNTNQNYRYIQIGGCAAFSILESGNEKLVIVAEITRNFMNDLKNNRADITAIECINLIRREIARVHQLQAHEIVLIKPTTLPKTSSGKVQRSKTKHYYQEDTLQRALLDAKSTDHTPSSSPLDSKTIKQWLRASCAELLDLSADTISYDEDLTYYGLSSISAMRLHGMIEQKLSIRLPQDLLWNALTINQIVSNLVRLPADLSQRSITMLSFKAIDQNEPFPLNSIQEAYWLGRSEHVEMGGVGCHLYIEFEQENINLENLARSWNHLINRHSMLRSVIDENGMQRVIDDVGSYAITHTDASDMTKNNKQALIDSIRQELSHKTYDASIWPLFEIRTTQLYPNITRIHFSYDLLIGDIWSLKLIHEEWGALYTTPDYKLDPIELTFRDYTTHIDQLRTTDSYRSSLQYWNAKVPTLPEAPKLPEGKLPSMISKPIFKRREKMLDATTWAKLKTKAKQAGITPSSLLCSAYADILAAWSQSRHFTLNLTLFNREPIHPDVSKIVGDFTTLLLLEVDNRKYDSFTERTLRLQNTLRNDLAHKSFNGIEVMQKISQCQGRSAASMPIVFTSALGFEEIMKTHYADWLGKSVYGVSQTPQVWLDHQVREENGKLLYSWDSVDELFSPNVIDEMFLTYTRLLEMLANSEAAWNDTMMCLTPGEQIAKFKSYFPTPPKITTTLYAKFIEQVTKYPDNTAIICPKGVMTYRELYDLSQQVAHQLHLSNIPKGSLIAIVMEKGREQAIGALGVLMYGCAYVPIDAATPKERINMLMKLSRTNTILSQSQLRDHFEPAHNVMYIDALQDINTRFYEYDAAHADDLAYVIFTSGSTGIPKGVMIDHKSAVNTIDDINGRFGISEKDRFFGVSSFAFDLSVYDLFGSLSSGAALVLSDPYLGIDPKHFSDLMSRHKVSVWNSAPALMQTFLEYIQANPAYATEFLQTVLLSGDWIAPTLPSLIRNYYTNAHVVSLGGATEASIWSIIYDTNDINPYCKSIPYGKALTNQELFVLGDKLEPRPTWVSGEIFIAGNGLALGYYHDAEKTNEKFIYHPMSGVRLYRTGDLGRVLPDGNIEFLGRKDFQVKISGYRIELGEIEHVIEQHPSVDYTIVTTYKDPHNILQIGAYIIPKYEISKIKTSIPCQDHTTMQSMTISAIERHRMQIYNVPQNWLASKQAKIHFNLPNKEEIITTVTILSKDGKSAVVSIDEERKSLYIQDYFYEERRSIDTKRILGLEPRNGWNNLTDVPCEIDAILIDHDQKSLLHIKKIAPGYVEALSQENLVVGDEVIIVFMPAESHEEINLRGKIISIDDINVLIELKPSPQQEHQLEKELFHWIIESKEWQEEFHDLLNHLHNHLPEYMIPKALCTLSHIPLTCNGKVDRNLLPDFKPIHLSKKTDAVLEPTEAKLLMIWQEILGTNDISIDDNFFDIGGYSQLAVRSLLKVKEVFQVEIPLRELFGTPTIRELAKLIDHISTTVPSSLATSDQTLYSTYARRGIGERIATIHADKYYTKAHGTILEYIENGITIEVLDMVGGYGSTILGHNHPELVEHMIYLISSLTPTHTQHTNNLPAGKIAKKLSDILGSKNNKSYISTLGSTGTEATEAAIKHAKMAHFNKVKRHTKNTKNFFALLNDSYVKGNIKLSDDLFKKATKKLGSPIHSFDDIIMGILDHNHKVYEKEPKFIVLNHAFHGMTSGAISLTASSDFKKPFHWMELNIHRISHTPLALQNAMEQSSYDTYNLSIDRNGAIDLHEETWHTIAGMFIEPIQGEGGIFVLDKAFAKFAREYATNYQFPLIIDEIQCGMGRSGTFRASEQLEIEGDYYLFSKSLGGGLTKISAMVVESSMYEKDFGYYHGSTFAEDQISAWMALKTLEILDRDRIMDKAKETGEIFLTKLKKLQRSYPNVFKDVRGIGLMLGIELKNLSNSESFLFRALANGGMEVLNHLIAGYLLNVHHIRIAPTKTRNTIRFLPSAYISIGQIDHVINALEEVAQIITHANAGRLLSYTVNSSLDYSSPVKDYRPLHPAYRNDDDEGCAKVAHIGHIEDEAMLIKAEPSLMDIEESLHEALLEVLFPVSKVTITQSITVPSQTGEKVNLKVIGIPLTGKQIKQMMNDESKNILLDRIDEAVEMAYHEGCSMVGMGGYTSIVTLNCTSAATTDIALTSGNGFTTALGIEGVEQLANKRDIDISKSTVGIVGAKGNIGSICAHIMAEQAESIILIGRDKHDEKLIEIAYEIHQNLPDVLIDISDSFTSIAQCDIVITATNSARPVIFPHHLSEKTKIICDIATPNDVDVSVSTQCPWCDLILGGLSTVPNTTINLHGTRLPDNHVYGCVAETMLLGLEGITTNFSFGSMNSDQVRTIKSASKKHGFKLGILKSIDLYGQHCVPDITSRQLEILA